MSRQHSLWQAARQFWSGLALPIAVLLLIVPAQAGTASDQPLGTPTAGTAAAGSDSESDWSVVNPQLDCKLIDFHTARLERRGLDVLVTIAGEAAYTPAEIVLLPVMYVMMPDYWQITVVGCRNKASAESVAAKPYAVERSINGALGRKGIRLMGVSQQLQLELPL